MPFPLTPVPSYYVTITHSGRTGIYYTGGTISVTLSSAANVTNYYVKDYYGNTVETGSIHSTTLNLAGPFNPGWYRVYMTGPSTDATFGPSYGVWSFMVVPTDSRFITNPSPGTSFGTGEGASEGTDAVMKGVLGIGTSRMQITVTNAPTTGSGTISNCGQNIALWNTYYLGSTDASFDSNRNRPMVVQFPNRSEDRVDLTLVGLSSSYLHVYLGSQSYSGAQVFVSSEAGSSSGSKVKVFYPNSSTLVETFDNLSSASASAAAVNASAYIRAVSNTVATGDEVTGPAAIGTAYHDGIVQVVQALFPQGVTYYEGPTNEGPFTAETAYRMLSFQKSVHDGNANAKAIGPCFVDISTLTGTQSWKTFLDAGGGSYCDELSTHMYNSQTNGDFNLGRTTMEAFKSLLAGYSLDSTPLWHTEATHVWTAVAGVHHPRRSRVPLAMTLLMEQYGIPREKNVVWYDRSHGFWAYPAWLVNVDRSPVPYATLYRTLAAETFRMTHYHRLDFGSNAANKIWLGSLYVTNKKTLGSSTLVLLMNSYMPGASVDLTITGTTAAITYVDGFGNTSSAVQSGGVVTIPTSDIPTYVRLPAGVTATVYQVNDWGASPSPSISSYGTASASQMNDDGFMTQYSNTAGVYVSTGSLPETAQIMFLANATFQRAIVFCGGAWQSLSSLTKFTVDTWDGASWTTQKSVDVSATCTSFQHGSDSNNTGCKQETFWPEQWIFDVKFPSPVTASGVRVSATATSYGGEPDAAAVAAGGQGNNNQRLTIQEIMVPSASTPGS